MVKPIDVLLRDHVRAPLKEKGYTRKGHNFRLTAPTGDIALIHFHSFPMGRHDVECYIEAAVLSVPYHDWLNHRLGRNDPMSTGGVIWSDRVQSPFVEPGSSLANSPFWELNLSYHEQIAELLRRVTAVADRLRHLLDRRNLLALARDPATRPQGLRPSREFAVGFLLVDDGPSPELEDALRELEEQHPADDLVAWLRTRQAARTPAPSRSAPPPAPPR